MNITTFMVVGPGEADRWLEQTMRQLHWADRITVCLNNAGDKERDIVEKYADYIREDNQEWGKFQWRIKQDYLDDLAGRFDLDWVWTLDADEIFDSRFTRETAERMGAGHDVSWYFWCLQLWNDEENVRLDLSFPNIRFYKYDAALGPHFQTTALHCGLAPRYAYKYGSQSGFYFKHYGLMLPEDRAKKVARYNKYDPNAKYKAETWYKGLRNEKPSSVITFEDAVGRLPGFIYKKKPMRVTASNPAESKTSVYVFMNKHGKAVEAIGDKQRDQFTKAGMKELRRIDVHKGGESPVIKKADGHETVESTPSSKVPANPPKKRTRPRKTRGDSANAPKIRTDLLEE